MHFMHVFFSITLSINSQKRLDPSNKIMKSRDKKFIVVILTIIKRMHINNDLKKFETSVKIKIKISSIENTTISISILNFLKKR